MAITLDTVDMVGFFAPLIYIAVLGRRDEPTQRLVALVESVAHLVQAMADVIGRRP